MVNNLELANRLRKIMEFYDLSSSVFADKIGVQRSSISHILSGRNKPSLDFILKVTNTFKEIDIYWLLNGKGIFPKNDDNSIKEAPSLPLKSHTDKKINRIVVFYNDGTFEEYLK